MKDIQTIDTGVVTEFVMRLCRNPLSFETAQFIADRALFILEREYGDSFGWVLMLIVSVLKNEDFDIVLLHQEEYPDVKKLVGVIREELVFNELKIT